MYNDQYYLKCSDSLKVTVVTPHSDTCGGASMFSFQRLMMYIIYSAKYSSFAKFSEARTKSSTSIISYLKQKWWSCPCIFLIIM